MTFEDNFEYIMMIYDKYYVCQCICGYPCHVMYDVPRYVLCVHALKYMLYDVCMYVVCMYVCHVMHIVCVCCGVLWCEVWCVHM